MGSLLIVGSINARTNVTKVAVKSANKVVHVGIKEWNVRGLEVLLDGRRPAGVLVGKRWNVETTFVIKSNLHLIFDTDFTV